MAINAALKQIMLTAGGAAITHVALHADATPESELSGGSPAYARRPFATVANGANLSQAGGVITFNVPAGAVITRIGLWSALTGGTNYGYLELPATETYGAQGILELLDLDVDLTDVVG